MSDDRRAEAAARFRRAVEMADFGRQMMLMKLRREHPEETEDQIWARFREQLDSRPMDAPGRVTRYPRP